LVGYLGSHQPLQAGRPLGRHVRHERCFWQLDGRLRRFVRGRLGRRGDESFVVPSFSFCSFSFSFCSFAFCSLLFGAFLFVSFSFGSFDSFSFGSLSFGSLSFGSFGSLLLSSLSLGSLSLASFSRGSLSFGSLTIGDLRSRGAWRRVASGTHSDHGSDHLRDDQRDEDHSRRRADRNQKDLDDRHIDYVSRPYARGTSDADPPQPRSLAMRRAHTPQCTSSRRISEVRRMRFDHNPSERG
jgi:hypothetical protein